MSNKNTYLKEMGVDVWVEREPKPAISSREIPTEVPLKDVATSIPIEPIEIDIQTLDWQALQLHASTCQRCDLSTTRTQTIFGAGNQSASLMIVADDRNQESGKLLTSMLKAMGYQRSDIYISNIVKCNIVENKDPSEEQSSSCEPYLLRQISLVQPKLILALGNVAAQHLLKNKSTMNRLRGQLHYVDEINAPILVSYHPTYLLASPNEKRKAWEDLQLAMQELNK